MAVSITATEYSGVGTGAAATYATGIYANASDQIKVYADGVLKTLGADYTLNNVGGSAGVDVVGTFTLGAAIYVERVTPITQLVDTQNNETILEDVLDAEFDKLTMIAQELNGKANRAILFPKGESGYTLPVPVGRANRFLAFGSDGTPLLAPGSGNAQAASPRFVYVEDYGAKGDGATDDTVSINAAITAAAIKGGTVWFGAATYRVTGTIIQKNGVTLRGAGPRATVLSFVNGASDCITAAGSAGNYLYGLFICDLQMSFSGKTGGRAVFWTYVANSAIENVEINGSYTGVDIFIANTVSLNRVRIITVAAGYALRWRAPADGSARNDVLNLADVVLAPGWGAVDGIVWSGLAQTMNMCNVAVLQARYGLAIKATPASFPNVPAFLEAINFQVEGASQQSVRIECGSQYHFFDCGLLNRYGTTGQGSADDYAVAIYGDVADSITNGIKFIGCHIGDCAKSTIYTEARGVIVSACSLVNGGRLAANTYPAVQVAAVAQDTDICDCRDYTWGALNNYKHMIQLDNGSIRNRVQGNFSVNPGTGLILNNSIAGDNQIEGNWTNKAEYSSADGFNGVPKTDSNATGHPIPAASFLAPILLRSGPGANFSDTTPTAAQIIAAIANPSATSCIRLLIANTTGFQMTLLTGTGVTFGGNVSGGNFVLAANTTRSFLLRVANSLAGSEAVNLLG